MMSVFFWRLLSCMYVEYFSKIPSHDEIHWTTLFSLIVTSWNVLNILFHDKNVCGNSEYHRWHISYIFKNFSRETDVGKSQQTSTDNEPGYSHNSSGSRKRGMTEGERVQESDPSFQRGPPPHKPQESTSELTHVWKEETGALSFIVSTDVPQKNKRKCRMQM